MGKPGAPNYARLRVYGHPLPVWGINDEGHSVYGKSMTAAAKVLGISLQTLSGAMRLGYRSRGYKWYKLRLGQTLPDNL